ncbi:hypothetical protein, partial [Salmonella enterica]|uniref:hypothetical protein n=1 Tax=Salmonella enterica TaxID=28901 RepID=UPI003CF25517
KPAWDEVIEDYDWVYKFSAFELWESVYVRTDVSENHTITKPQYVNEPTFYKENKDLVTGKQKAVSDAEKAVGAAQKAYNEAAEAAK